MSVQNRGTGRSRGRPRAFDPDGALDRALDAFWAAGYAGTSLDALGAATGLNRPSLYLAFGDKHALYQAAMRRYAEGTLARLEELLSARPLRAALLDTYARAIAFYLAGEKAARGCFLIGTSLAEAVNDEAVRASVLSALHRADRIFQARFAAAREAGELPALSAGALAELAAGVLHTIAVRARAGAAASELEAIAAAAVDLICGAAGAAGTSPPP